jgi:hypothetical protein
MQSRQGRPGEAGEGSLAPASHGLRVALAFMVCVDAV